MNDVVKPRPPIHLVMATAETAYEAARCITKAMFKPDFSNHVAHYTCGMPPMRTDYDWSGLMQDYKMVWAELVMDEMLNPSPDCQAMHDHLVARLAAQNWTGAGPTAIMHDWLVPFDELPLVSTQVVRMLHAVVRSVVEMGWGSWEKGLLRQGNMHLA